jgi:hypothetical protein
MAIHKIHAVPDDLPHARLYLDDIEEISRILLEAAAAAQAESARRFEKDLGSDTQSLAGKAAAEAISKRDLHVNYTIGDSRMDSISDLQTYGGSTANFRIQVGTWGNGIRFYFWSKPTIELHSLDDKSQWSTYGKIKSVFERRQLRTKNAIEALPGWLRWAVWLSLMFVPTVIALTGITKPRSLYLIIGLAAHNRALRVCLVATEPSLFRALT